MTTTQQLYDAAVRMRSAGSYVTSCSRAGSLTAFDNAYDALEEAIAAYEAEQAEKANRNDWR